MNKNIHKVANKFIKALKGEINFVSAENYLASIGFKVLFFNTPIGNKEIDRYDLQEKASTLTAFTYCSTAHIIFINNNMSTEDKLYLLLHEVGHILLGHVGDGKLYTRNKILIDIEADAFTYEVLNPTKNHYIRYSCVAFMIVFIFLGCYYINIISSSQSATLTLPVERYEILTDNSPGSDDLVYITPSGNKYHQEDCRYTKDKDCIMLTRKDAQKRYAPCSVCNP